MSKKNFILKKYNDRQAEYELLSEKIKRLRTAKAIETDPAVQLKLEIQIKEAESENDKLEIEIANLEEQMDNNISSSSVPSLKENDLSIYPAKQNQIYSNLPNTTTIFVGRDFDIQKSFEKLKEWRYLVVEGVGGVGKSSFAEIIAKKSLNEHLIDGVVWVDCKYQKVDINDVVNIFASTFDYKKLLGLDLVAKMQLAKELLQSIGCLFILDNYETSANSELTDWLMKLPNTTQVIFTIRKGKDLLTDNIALITLRGLSEESSMELIKMESERLGKPELSAYANEIFQKTHSLVDGLPLALRWICSQIGLKGRPIELVAADLESARGNFYDPLFYYAYDSLTTDLTRQILQILSIFIIPVNIDVFKYLIPNNSVDPSLEDCFSELLQYNLIEVVGGITVHERRYTLHPITQSYASSILQKNPYFLSETKNKIVKFMLDLVENYGGDDNWNGYVMLDLWNENILYFINWCSQKGSWKIVFDFVKNYHYYLWARGFWQQRKDIGLLALNASNELNNGYMKIWVKTRVLFDAYLLLGDFPHAETYLEEAINEAATMGDNSLLAWAYYQKARLLRRTKDLKNAISFASNSVNIYQTLDDKHSFGYVLNGLANVENDSKNYPPAERYYQQSLRIFEQTTDNMMRAVVTRNLAKLYRNQRDFERSVSSYKSAILIFQSLGLELETAESKSGLAETLLEVNDYDEAIQLIQSSIGIFKKLGALHESSTAAIVFQKIVDKQAEVKRNN